MEKGLGYNGAVNDEHKQQLRAAVARLAERALDAALDAPGHRPRAGTVTYRLTAAVPAARARLNPSGPPPEPAAELQDPAVRVVDGRGQTRPVYASLARWLHGGDWSAGDRGTVDGRAWSRLIGATGVFPVDDLPAGDGPLHEQGPDDAPDFWTYQELTALHAWDALAEWFDDPRGRDRVAAAARWHVGHTQPDYTTYQPWALAAFGRRAETRGFAEQQLHDAETQLNLAGGAGSVVAGVAAGGCVGALGVRGAAGAGNGRDARSTGTSGHGKAGPLMLHG